MRDKKVEGIGKLPPQATELEEAVLGALMLEKDAINEISEILSRDSFYKESHKVIYEAIVQLFCDSEPIDLLTVTNRLRRAGNLEKAGGAFTITELTSRVSSAANIQVHARIIAEMAIKRDIISMAGALLRDAYDDTSDGVILVEKAEKAIIDINSGYFNSGKSKYVKDILPEAIKAIESASKKPSGVTGIPSGIYALDKVTGGWQNSDLIIIGARSGMGKSDLAVNLVLNAAKAGFKTALYTLEMSSIQLVNRMISVDREIERLKIRSGNFNQDDWESLSMFSSKVANNAIVVDDPGINHITMRSSARKLKLKEKIDMIVLDYLQLVETLGKGKTTNDKVSEISRSLKLMAKELNIPVIALSQLSRAVETRGGDKRPVLSDLRDSGSIEQDADIVIFPYRPEYYEFNTREDGSSTHQLMEVDIAKHRNGSVETVDARYLGKFGKMTDWIKPNIPEVEPAKVYHPDRFHSSGIDNFDKPSPF
jgi:replicative DNA helicase